MSIIRNRELSQFGSFIYIDNNSQDIGITTETTPYVGIGTTNPTVKLEVIGDTNIDGNINSSSYTINGYPLIDATLQLFEFATNGVDLYNLDSNVGIGTSVFAERLTVNGNVSAGRFISTVTNTSPLFVQSSILVTNLNANYLNGKSAPSSNIVGTTDTQTLTNKTLTSPKINSIIFTGAVSGTTSLSASSTASGSLFLPTSGGTLLSTNSVGLVTTGNIANGTIVNADISTSAAIAVSKLAASTISGITLGNNLTSLSFGSYLTSTGSYNGSNARTVSVAGTSLNSANTLVARDSSGNFSAGSINCNNLTAAFDINSTSDETLKNNINTIQNSLGIVESLRGVSFEWKETGKSSYGVIAQEVEKILPELITTQEKKSVNYNGIIGILIEAVKELSAEVEELKKKVL